MGCSSSHQRVKEDKKTTLRAVCSEPALQDDATGLPQLMALPRGKTQAKRRTNSTPFLQKRQAWRMSLYTFKQGAAVSALSPTSALSRSPLLRLPWPNTAPGVHLNIPICLFSFFFHLVIFFFYFFKQSKAAWVADRSWEYHKDKKR